MTEKEIESQILTWLNLQQGIFAFKVNTVGVFDPIKKIYRTNKNPFLINGTSDILACIYGSFVAIEVKTPSGLKSFLNPKKEREINQVAFLKKVKEKGKGYALAVSSLDMVIEFVKRLDLKKLN
jgi:hypothetical protein